MLKAAITPAMKAATTLTTMAITMTGKRTARIIIKKVVMIWMAAVAITSIAEDRAAVAKVTAWPGVPIPRFSSIF